MTEENKVLEVLKSPELLEIIVNDMKLLGFKADDKELLLIYLTIVSRFNDQGLYTCFTGGCKRLDFLPLIEYLIYPDESMMINNFNTETYFYDIDIFDKCLLITEMDDKGLLGILLKDKKLNCLSVADINGEKKAIEKRFKFKGSAFICADKKMDKNLFSLFYVIKQNRIEKSSFLIRDNQKEDKFKIAEKHHAIQKYLKKRVIILPDLIINRMSFPAEEVRYRRDHQRFLDLILTVCFLRQYQKEIKYFSDGEEYIKIDSIDYDVAYNIFVHCANQDKTFNRQDIAFITIPEKMKEAVN